MTIDPAETATNQQKSAAFEWLRQTSLGEQKCSEHAAVMMYEVARLKTVATLAAASLAARDKEARAARTFENAQENFSKSGAEERAYSLAMAEASEADKALRDAPVAPDAKSTGAAHHEQCRCTMAQRLVGDGCAFCNPELAREIERENFEDDAEHDREMAIQARIDAAVAAARERFAKLCESLKSAGEYQYNNGCDDSAAAIRGA